MRKRKKTLPLVWALAHASVEERARLVEIYARPGHGVEGRDVEPIADAPLSDAEVNEVLAMLERCGAREHTLSEARRYRDLALSHLEQLPCAPDRRKQLAELVSSVIAA